MARVQWISDRWRLRKDRPEQVAQGGGFLLRFLQPGQHFLPVAVVISLTEGKRFNRVWKECYFWSFPYYLAGAAIAGLLSVANHFLGWQTALLIFPVIYWMYRSYRLYLGRLEDEKKQLDPAKKAALKARTGAASAVIGPK